MNAANDGPLVGESVVVPGMSGGFEAKIVRADRCIFRIEADASEFSPDELRWFERLVARIARKKARPHLRVI